VAADGARVHSVVWIVRQIGSGETHDPEKSGNMMKVKCLCDHWVSVSVEARYHLMDHQAYEMFWNSADSLLDRCDGTAQSIEATAMGLRMLMKSDGVWKCHQCKRFLVLKPHETLFFSLDERRCDNDEQEEAKSLG
jgi:hypothetical protein